MKSTNSILAVHSVGLCAYKNNKYEKHKKHSCRSPSLIYVWQKEIMQFASPSNAVLFSVWSSTFFYPMQYMRWFVCCGKQSVCISVNSKFLLNRKYGESVLYEKVSPCRYLSNGVSFESFRPAVCKKFAKNGRFHSSSAARFSKLT